MSASTEPLPGPLLPREKLPPLPLPDACPGPRPRGERAADRMEPPGCPKPPPAAADPKAPAAAPARLLLDALRDTCGDMPSSSGCMWLLSRPVSIRACCCCSWQLLLLLDPVSMPPLWSHAWALRDSPLAEGEGRDSGWCSPPRSCCWLLPYPLLKAPWRLLPGPAAACACGDALPPTSIVR